MDASVRRRSHRVHGPRRGARASCPRRRHRSAHPAGVFEARADARALLGAGRPRRHDGVDGSSDRGDVRRGSASTGLCPSRHDASSREGGWARRQHLRARRGTLDPNRVGRHRTNRARCAPRVSVLDGHQGNPERIPRGSRGDRETDRRQRGSVHQPTPDSRGGSSERSSSFKASVGQGAGAGAGACSMAGSCWVLQCSVPRPTTRSVAWIPMTSRDGKTSARIDRARRSLASLKVGTST